MNSLTRFENDGIEIFIDTKGNSFASLNGVARMAQKAPTQIQRLSSLRNFVLQQVEIDTGYGKKLVTLFNEDQILVVLQKYNGERLLEFAKLGVNTALHQLAGYQKEQQDRPNLNTFTIYDLKPWQVERLVLSIGYRGNDESIPGEYLEGMDDLDMSIWEIPFDVINWLQSLHQDLIEEFLYRKCLENNKLSSTKVLQDYVHQFEANVAVGDYSEVRDMSGLIEPFEKIQLVQKELAVSTNAKSKPLGFGKPKNK